MTRAIVLMLLLSLPAAAISGSAVAGSRCNADVGDCRDSNPGTATSTTTTSQQGKKKTTTPRDTATGQATGKRVYKPIR